MKTCNKIALSDEESPDNDQCFDLRGIFACLYLSDVPILGQIDSGSEISAISLSLLSSLLPSAKPVAKKSNVVLRDVQGGIIRTQSGPVRISVGAELKGPSINHVFHVFPNEYLARGTECSALLGLDLMVRLRLDFMIDGESYRNYSNRLEREINIKDIKDDKRI